MRLPFPALLAAVPIAIVLLPVSGLTHDADPCNSPDFIVTAAPAYEPLAELRGQERFPKGAHLLLVHAGNAEPLVSGFADSMDANVSFDGQTVSVFGETIRERSLADLGIDTQGSLGAPSHRDGNRCRAPTLFAGRTDGVGRAHHDWVQASIRRRRPPDGIHAAEPDDRAGVVAAHLLHVRTHFLLTCAGWADSV